MSEPAVEFFRAITRVIEAATTIAPSAKMPRTETLRRHGNCNFETGYQGRARIITTQKQSKLKSINGMGKDAIRKQRRS